MLSNLVERIEGKAEAAEQAKSPETWIGPRVSRWGCRSLVVYKNGCNSVQQHRMSHPTC